jgi:copper chaperone
MLTFRVDDMTCGHCAGAITKAVQAAAPGVAVVVDLAQHMVLVEADATTAAIVAAAISDAGYTPVPVTGTAPEAPRTSGCCCGSGRSSCRA